MTTVTFRQKDGQEITTNAENGLSLMVAAVEKNIEGIKAVCNGCCSCGTCHISIVPALQNKLSTMYSGEKQVLSKLRNCQQGSRLACQVIVDEKLEGITVTIK